MTLKITKKSILTASVTVIAGNICQNIAGDEESEQYLFMKKHSSS